MNKGCNFLTFGTSYSCKLSENFIIIYGEELQSFRHCNYNSKFAQDLLENGHQTGNIDKVMKMLHAAK